jgi:hypothetical protein
MVDVGKSQSTKIQSGLNGLGGKPMVELSPRDPFFGAREEEAAILDEARRRFVISRVADSKNVHRTFDRGVWAALRSTVLLAASANA